VARRRRVDSEQLAGMDEDDGLHLCENKTKGYWAVLAPAAGLGLAAVGL
jgi:hypothetical protein